MAIVPLFKNRFGAVNVSTPDGTVLKFAGGRYFTQDKAYIEYLTELAETKQSGVFIDKAEPEVDTENLDPMAAIKAKIRKDIEADIKSGKINAATPSTPGNVEQAQLQNSTTNTMGSASPQGTPVAKAQETVKVDGETGDKAPSAPSKLEELKAGKK